MQASRGYAYRKYLNVYLRTQKATFLLVDENPKSSLEQLAECIEEFTNDDN
jgi:hypothetical protein